ncbi:DoxX family protein [Brevibacillus fluminis]|uniref:DoxX family protein n=1 Tax=Brevibacillus fluminis TaxID=511487 RepID=A0A3M8DNE8_9BACL|nr:DoxX family protein [Brevibacillus fluminis]
MNKQQVANTVLHVVLGIIFFVHGLAKLQMGLDNVAGWFGSMGLPGFLGYAVAFIELLGGAALIIGLGVRYVSILLAIVMLGAIFKVKLANGLLGGDQGPGYELDLALLAAVVYFIIAGVKGPVDRMFGKKQS